MRDLFFLTFSLILTANISHFRSILNIVSSPPFYNEHVRLPKANDPPSPSLLENPKLFPYFEDAVGSIDGTHVDCVPSADERAGSRNRKGGVSQNCLACCDFEMRFQYLVSGHEGSVADAYMYEQARLVDLPIPKGKYYLADAGFGICDALLVPYRGVRYHLAEWGRAAVRYVSQKLLCIC